MPVLPLVASMTVCPGPIAGALGVLDHAKRQTILDRTERIECLNLDDQVDPGGRQPPARKETD